MKEKLQQYALIAEIVSAIAIIASLIFVGLQVKQGAEQTAANTEAIRGSVRQAMMETDRSQMLWLGERPKIRNIPQLIKEEKLEELDQDDVFTYSMFALSHLRARQLYWTQFKAGLLDEATYKSYMYLFVLGVTLGSDGENPVWRRAYEEAISSGVLPQEFTNEINRLRNEFGIKTTSSTE